MACQQTDRSRPHRAIQPAQHDIGNGSYDRDKRTAFPGERSGGTIRPELGRLDRAAHCSRKAHCEMQHFRSRHSPQPYGMAGKSHFFAVGLRPLPMKTVTLRSYQRASTSGRRKSCLSDRERVRLSMFESGHSFVYGRVCRAGRATQLIGAVLAQLSNSSKEHLGFIPIPGSRERPLRRK